MDSASYTASDTSTLPPLSRGSGVLIVIDLQLLLAEIPDFEAINDFIVLFISGESVISFDPIGPDRKSFYEGSSDRFSGEMPNSSHILRYSSSFILNNIIIQK